MVEPIKFSDAYKGPQGFVKIWRVHKETGSKELVVDKKNLVLKQGAKVLASALAGITNAKISKMYIGFNNAGSFTAPVIDVDYSEPFNQLSIPDGFGYLREPLSLPPSLTSYSGYDSNIVTFTTIISSSTAFYGNVFTSGTSNIYEVALVAALSNDSSDDLVYARVGFDQITYNDNYALTISWGTVFLVNS